ncbi:MAG TPA: DUF2080 family transposase-associated protein [Candidatus Nanoarchaeia archaeon]|nr:DUF2080 family transposase-associated protein [Candidatus Nanoarchaeia archaeon]
MKRKITVEDFKEILERDISPFGNGAHIIVPQKHSGKKAIIIIKE